MKSCFHLDLRGNISPLSLLKATEALSRLDGGQRLEILGTDDQTKKELFEIIVTVPRVEARAIFRAVPAIM